LHPIRKVPILPVGALFLVGLLVVFYTHNPAIVAPVGILISVALLSVTIAARRMPGALPAVRYAVWIVVLPVVAVPVRVILVLMP
jgi:hypothetical protein